MLDQAPGHTDDIQSETLARPAGEKEGVWVISAATLSPKEVCDSELGRAARLLEQS